MCKDNCARLAVLESLKRGAILTMMSARLIYSECFQDSAACPIGLVGGIDRRYRKLVTKMGSDLCHVAFSMLADDGDVSAVILFGARKPLVQDGGDIFG